MNSKNSFAVSTAAIWHRILLACTLQRFLFYHARSRQRRSIFACCLLSGSYKILGISAGLYTWHGICSSARVFGQATPIVGVAIGELLLLSLHQSSSDLKFDMSARVCPLSKRVSRLFEHAHWARSKYEIIRAS